MSFQPDIARELLFAGVYFPTVLSNRISQALAIQMIGGKDFQLTVMHRYKTGHFVEMPQPVLSQIVCNISHG